MRVYWLQHLCYIFFGILVSLCTNQGLVPTSFANEPRIVTINGFAYIKGCEYYSTSDISKDAFLLINGTIKIKFNGPSTKVNKTVPIDVQNELRNSTAKTTTSTTISKSSSPVTTTATTTTRPKLTLPITTPKLPFRIGRSLMFLGGFGKKIKEKVDETVKKLVKNILVFDLPNVLMKLSGYYQCVVDEGNTVSSSRSDFLKVPAPNIFKGPLFLSQPGNTGEAFAIKGCVIKSNYEIHSGDMFWWKDGEILEKTSYAGGNGTYVIATKNFNTTTISDQGVYQCGIKDSQSNEMILSSKISVSFKDVATNLVSVTLAREWDNALYNSSSIQYKNLSDEIKRKISKSLRENDIKNVIQMVKFRPGSIIADVSVIYEKGKEQKQSATCPDSLQEELFSGLNVKSIAVKSLDCCLEHSFGDEELEGRYHVPATTSPNTLTLPCQYNPTQNFTIQCKTDLQTGPSWSKPNLGLCDPKFESTKMLRLLLEKKTCTFKRRFDCLDVVEFAKQLRDTIITYGIHVVEDLIMITDIVTNRIITKVDVFNVQRIHKIIPPLFEVVEFVLSEPEDLIGLAEIEFGNSNALLKSLDRIGIEYLKVANLIEKFNLNIPLDIKIDGINIAFNVKRVKKEPTLIFAKQSRRKVSIEITRNTKINITDDIISMIQIPAEAIGDNDFIYSYYYKNPLLFMEEETLLRVIGNSTSLTRAVQSNVFSANIGTKEVRNLLQPVLLTFKKSRNLNFTGTSSCDYWDFDKKTTIRGVKGGWSNAGCRISTLQQHSDYHSCECDHLTNFALLLDVSGTVTASEELSIVTLIGCALSIFGLSITVLSFLVFKDARNGLPQKLMFSLSCSLLLLLIFFLVGIERTSNKTECKIYGALIHYFMLTTFLWMGVQAVMYYRSFVLVFNTTNKSYYFIVSSIIVWVLPAVVVIITAVIAHDKYANEKICMVSGVPFYASVVGPISAILLFNICVTVIVMRHLHETFKNQQHRIKEKRNIREVRIGFACCVLMGVTWIFGLLAVGYTSMVFQWLFCIFNPLQGFLLFVLFTLRNKVVRDSWKKCFGMDKDTTMSSKSIHHESHSLKNVSSSTGNSMFYNTGSITVH